MLYSHTIKLVRFYEGADGLKTGFTDNAKYCMAVTAKRDGMRLLAIVLGEDVSKVRNQETTALLDYGFSMYQVDILKKKGEVIDSIKVEKGNVNNVDVITDSEITILRKKNEESKKYSEKIELNELSLPINKGDIVGKLKILDGNNLVGEYKLIASKDVKKKSFINLFLDNLKDMIIGKLEF